MPRHSGRRGKVKAPIGGSVTITNELLTANADGVTWESAHEIWDKSDPDLPCIEPDGLISGGGITPNTAANDSVLVAAGSVKIAGATVAFTAGTLSSIARPGAGETRISAITVDSSGTLALVAGTSGAAGGARGAVGGPPYIPVGKVLLGYVTLTANPAALVVAGEIDNDAAERTAIPGFTVDYINGDVVFDSALPLIHTADVAKKVYATYKYLTLQDIGNIDTWSLEQSSAKIEMIAFNEDSVAREKLNNDWSGTIAGFHVNSYWFDLAEPADIWFLELYDDRRVTNCWRGYAIIDWGISVTRDAAVKESMSFVADGPFVRTGSYAGC